MENELKEICSLLDGYMDTKYEIICATKAQNGTWELTIKKMKKTEAEAANERN